MKTVFPGVLIGSFKEDKDLSWKGQLFPQAVEGPHRGFHAAGRQAAFFQELGGGKNDAGSGL